ncbi:Uncharacterised protein [Mycobacteroides abscessus]|nr:Uncharacterised protein [Mycobacteroides abscessus]
MGRNQSSKFSILSRMSWMVPCRVCMSTIIWCITPVSSVMLASIFFMVVTMTPI